MATKAFEVKTVGTPDFEVSLNVGKTAKEGREAAKDLANVIYANAKVSTPSGQAFKNQVIESLLGLSNRCQQAAEGYLGTGTAKAVIGEKVGSKVKDTCCQ